jgi:hypothetical protein
MTFVIRIHYPKKFEGPFWLNRTIQALNLLRPMRRAKKNEAEWSAFRRFQQHELACALEGRGRVCRNAVAALDLESRHSAQRDLKIIWEPV